MLPANILVADPASEWMRLAVPIVLEQDLVTSRDVIATIAANEASVYQFASTVRLPTEELRTTVQVREGRFDLNVTVGDLSTERVRQVFSSRAPSLIGALNGAAKQIGGGAVEFPTRSERALRAFVEGITAGDAPLRIQRLRDAVGADNSFGVAYIALVQSLAATNSSDTLTALGEAFSHRASFTAVDKVRFDLLRNRLLHAPLAQQTSAARAVIELLPNDVDGLASAASALFLSSRGGEAEGLMNRAITINPDDANLRQQLVSGLIAVKQYARAEKLLRGFTGNPAILPELASCILLEGDTARANGVFESFLQSVADPDAKLLLRASWHALVGNRAEAARQLANVQFRDARIGSFAKGQLIVWQILDKRFDSAKASVSGAPPLAAVLGQGVSSAQELKLKIDGLPSNLANAEDKRATLRNGYFLLGFYPEAVQAWRQADSEAGGADLRARTMLAASLNATGQKEQALKVPVQPFTPELSDFYNAVSFSQLRILTSH